MGSLRHSNTPRDHMTVIDYNGTGPLSAKEILRRYEEYARRFRVKQRRYLAPLCHEEKGTRWIYPVMDDVIEGIKDGDLACIALGVDSIGEDKCFPFGRILKSRTARALRQTGLPSQYHERVRNRIIQMLIASKCAP